jgi:hypothetical protein
MIALLFMFQRSERGFSFFVQNTSSFASPLNLGLGNGNAVGGCPKENDTIQVFVNREVLSLLNEDMETAKLSCFLRKKKKKKTKKKKNLKRVPRQRK